MRGDILSLPHYAFIAWCLVKHRDNFILQVTLDSEKDGGKKYA
jgi:hypothetical protein